MRSYRYFHYDVFTDRVFGGNQLAVVLDARGLAADIMQAVANEMNYAETTFILPAERPDTDVRMRIFTPSAELPMAGHPTVGSTFALARAGVICAGRDRFVFGLTVGPTLVSLTWRGGDLGFAWMTQMLPNFGGPLERAPVAAALGLAEADIAGAGAPVQDVSCGLPCLMVPVATRRAVDSAVVSRTLLDDLPRAIGTGAKVVFLFSVEPGDDEANAYCRMFAPALGVPEDPATGGAHGPLGCYLVKHKLVPPARAGSILSRQGVKMGRPSSIHVAIGVEGGEISSVQVGGESVLAGEGTLYIP